MQQTELANTKPHRRSPLVATLGVLAGLCGTYFLFHLLLHAWGSSSAHFSIAENVTPSEAPIELPIDATRFSYGTGYRGTKAVEFDTNEQSFRKWVEAGIGSWESNWAQVPVKEIEEQECIRTYKLFMPGAPEDDLWVNKTRHCVHTGLVYSWRKEDRAVQAVFDRLSNRAYYWCNWH